MIPTKIEKPASEIVSMIQREVGAVGAGFKSLDLAACSVKYIFETSERVVNALNFLGRYAGNERVITYANSEASRDPVYFVPNSQDADGNPIYDVRIDFLAIRDSLVAIKDYLCTLDYSGGTCLLQADGMVQWKEMDITSIQPLFDDYFKVVDLDK